MDLLNKIDEATKPKPSFDEWLNDKKNYRKIKKEFMNNYDDLASEEGQNILDTEYYDEENDEYILEDPIEAYENYAHTTGYTVEYGAAEYTIYKFKREFDYKRHDESDEEKQYVLAKKMGYRPSFR